MPKYQISQEQYEQIMSVGKVINSFIKTMSKDFNEDVVNFATMAQKEFSQFTARKEKTQLSKESSSNLHNVNCYLHQQIKNSENMFKVGSKYEMSLQALSAGMLMLNNAMSAIWQADDDELDKNIEFYSKVQEENKFMSVWSFYELFERDKINEVCSLNFKIISYNGRQYKTNDFQVGHKSTWLQLWAFLDNVIKMSGDTHHIFIEDLVGSGFDEFDLITGS